jgi:pimeloyl-ACP methyl ester carboxylesterase
LVPGELDQRERRRHGAGRLGAVVAGSGPISSNNPSGCWSLAVSPDGNTLAFVTQTNGAGEVHAQIPIVWDAGDWHNLVITYCATNCSIFLEGSLVTNAPPIADWPGPDVCANGFYVGSDPSGTLQAHAQFQELETYGVPLSADFIKDNYDSVSDEILAWGGTLPALGAGGIGGITEAAGPPTLPGMGGGGGGGVTNVARYSTPIYTTNSDVNYNDYTNFWLAVGTSSSNKQAAVTLQNTLSNLTYQILTNSILDTNLADWGVWQVLTASNSVIVAPPFPVGSNSLFFASQLVLITGTNQIADWWQMKYFGQLGVDPYADPDLDGLCNYSEYILGSNPTNAHSMSATKTDAQYFFLAYTNDSSTRLLLFQSNGPGTNEVTLTLSNTFVGTNYQIYSKNMSVTNGAWRVETNFLGTNNATQITIPLNGRTLAFIGGDGEDPDGDGLPSGYEVLATHTDPLLADTGNTGTPDGYKDPDGDGYVNLAEYYNGTDPLVWDPPAAPGGLNVVLNNSGTNQTASLTWNPSGGSVSNYVIYRDTGSGFVPIATNSASSTSYTDHSLPTNGTANYEIQAIYPLGSSLKTSYVSAFSNPSYNFPIAIVNGASNRLYLVVSAMPANVTNFVVTRTVYNSSSDLDAFYPIDTQRWLQTPNYYSPSVTDGTFSISQASFTNGVAPIPTNLVPPYGTYDLSVQAVGSDGKLGSAVACWGPSVSPMFGTFGAVPFLDGTAQMKNNLAFLLSLGNAPFDYTPYYLYAQEYGENLYITGDEIVYPSDYVYSSYFSAYGSYNQFQPFEDNCIFSDFQYNRSFGSSAHPSSYPAGVSDYSIITDMAATFPTYSYITSSNMAPIPPSLVMSSNPWFYLTGEWFGPDPAWGVSQNGSALNMTSGCTNLYGLPYLSFQVPNESGSNYLLNPSQSMPASDNAGLAYSCVQLPALRTVGFYFARLAQFDLASYGVYSNETWIYELCYNPTTASDPMPGNSSPLTSAFATSTTTPLMITSVGQPLYIAGYAKQVATNGLPNVFAYLGQYFTNALLMQNGVPTTNAGIVSEYGSFFPTLPGQIALMTKPDPDQGNQQGQCLINVIRLSLDVNHDGTMDESFTGPDNTTAERPFAFWANNNYDRWTSSILDSAPFQDDVASTDSAANSPYTGLPVPDYDYRDANGQRMIPCTRDLQDFTRLWVSGVSNTLSRLPSGSTVTLSWAGNGTSPTIDLFQAADADGGMGYLTNETTASNQINTNLCQYVGRLGTGGSIQLNASTFSNGWAGDHFIWCGVWYGSDQLNLTVTDGNGNMLAQSSQWIQIQDIKQMYERWTVGDNDDNLPLAQAVPMSNAVPVANGFSPGCPTQPFTYSYNAAYDTNDTYILYVHGWNEEVWRKDRWAESAYKRLYWQGYQGRFGLFRWPCFNLSFVNAITRPHYYDWSEWNAWKTGQSLETFLANTLNSNYPGHVYLLAHSQGNVVAGEALRLAPSRVVNTYVASQGALSARAFDNTLPTNAASYYTITTSDPQGNYYTNGAPSYFSASAGAGTYVNFFNTNDWALMGNSISLAAFHPGWLYDQSLKPDANLKFYYEAPSPTVPSGYYYYPLVAGNYQVVPLIFPTNTYEVFAMCAQSYSRALGAQVGVNGPFLSRQINLSASPYNFGSTHIQHDEQFTFDNMTTSAYWQQLLVSFALKPTP